MKCRFVLGGKVWTYRETPLKKLYGVCKHYARRILVDPNVIPREKAETQIHEIMHALFPYLQEDTVDTAAKELTTALCHLNTRFKRKWLDD